MTSLKAIREKFPQYQDMSDADLASGLHQKYYSDMPRADFDAKIGLKKDFGIDWQQPRSRVRAAIAKLPEADRRDALRQWADAYVAKERKEGGVGMAADNTVRTLGRGHWLGEGLDELTALTNSGLHTITGGYAGAPYDEILAYQRARDRAVDKDYPLASAVGRLTGGVLSGGAALKLLGQGNRMAAFAVGGPFAAVQPSRGLRPVLSKGDPGLVAQGAAAAPVYGAVARGLSGEGEQDRFDRATDYDAIGTDAFIGAVAPVALSGAGYVAGKAGDWTAPLRARVSGAIQDRFNPPARPATSGGAAAVTPGGSATATGPDEAANVMIAQQLTRAGIPRGRLGNQLDQVDYNRTFYGNNSRAPDAVALADLDPSLAKLAGSAARYQPEAYNRALSFSRARQTGYPEAGLGPQQAGLQTAERLSRDPTGRRATGQFGRVRDALKRALTISDEDYHKHQGNAFRTREAIENAADAAADAAYGSARAAGANPAAQRALARENADLITRWVARGQSEPQEVANLINRVLRNLRRMRGDVGGVHKVKMFLDREIRKQFRETGDSTNQYTGGVLSELRDDLIAGIRRVPKVGDLYENARVQYMQEMRKLEAMQLGRDAWKENSEVGIDAYRNLKTDDERKLFRLGLYGGFDEQYGGGKARNRNITTVFETPRIQELFSEVIPSSKDLGGTFADRPQRFGRYLDSQRDMVETPRRVLGNSATAERLADDAQFNQLQTAVEEIMAQPGLASATYVALRRAMNSLFGVRADTAAAIARKLFDANPETRAQTIRAIERHMGRERTEVFARYMASLAQRASRSTASTAGGSMGGDE